MALLLLRRTSISAQKFLAQAIKTSSELQRSNFSSLQPRLCAGKERCDILPNRNLLRRIPHREVSTEKKNDEAKETAVVYRGELKSMIKGIKLFSFTTSIGSLAVQPFLIRQALESDNLVILYSLLGSVGAFAFLTPILLQIFVKRYVLRLEYDSRNDKYIAITYSFFMREKKLEFSPDDVVVPEISGMFTTCKAKGYPLLIDPRSFGDISHFKRIMGYDKPLDFKLTADAPNIVENAINKVENK